MAICLEVTCAAKTRLAEEMVEQAIRLKADGLSNGNIICAPGIHESTFYRWIGLLSLPFLEGSEGLILIGGVGCGKTHMAGTLRALACESRVEARFFTASSLVMRLRRARDEGRLDRGLSRVGRARMLSWTSPASCRSTRTARGRCSGRPRRPTGDSRPRSPRTRGSPAGGRSSATTRWPPRSSTARSTTAASCSSGASHTGCATRSCSRGSCSKTRARPRAKTAQFPMRFLLESC